MYIITTIGSSHTRLVIAMIRFHGMIIKWAVKERYVNFSGCLFAKKSSVVLLRIEIEAACVWLLSELARFLIRHKLSDFSRNVY